MKDCIKNLFCKKPDVILFCKSENPIYGSRHITFARSFRIGSRRVVDHSGDTILLNDDGTVSGHYVFTHWEAV